MNLVQSEWAYSSYGLSLLADGEIPGLARGTSASPVDVRIRLNKLPSGGSSAGRVRWYQTERFNAQGRPNLVIWRTVPQGAFHFVYDNQTEFLIQPDGREIWCAWAATATIADAAVYLRGPVLGFVLRLRGILCLHASAVAVGAAALAVVGSAGAGKSTTAAGFVKLGYPLLVDDVAALKAEGDAFHVLPGCPRLGLWPDAGVALYGNATPLPRLIPHGGVNEWWDKRYVDLEVDRQFLQMPLPLAAIYLLGERVAASRPCITHVSAKDALMRLAEDTYVNYALDASMRAEEFRALGRLVLTTRMRLVHQCERPTRVLDLCDAILEDYKELT